MANSVKCIYKALYLMQRILATCQEMCTHIQAGMVACCFQKALVPSNLHSWWFMQFRPSREKQSADPSVSVSIVAARGILGIDAHECLSMQASISWMSLMELCIGMQAVKQQLEPFIFEWTRAGAGSISAEHGIGVHKREILHYSQPPVALDLMNKIKAVLDPKNTLNPGKIVNVSAHLAAS
jgi:FAD linked oxidases, C-terminal domain